MSKRVAIGIDLGTTYSCVGVLLNGRVELIANSVGRRITPSFVGFDDEDEFVGEAAKSQALVNHRNTIFEAKRLIGRRVTEPCVQCDILQWPFEVVDAQGTPKFKVRHKHQEKILTPEQVSAKVLSSMRDIAETFVGGVITDAVITVPAYFNDSQRQATIDAGKIAGLNVLQLLNEPTAAAIAFGVDKNISREKHVLVFDLGGGTLDVVVLAIVNKTFVVKAVGGDTHLGGSDFDSKLLEHFLAFIKKKYSKDLSAVPRALGRLRNACEQAKITLSMSPKGTVTIDSLFDGIDFQGTISRTKFEELCQDLFAKSIQVVESVLSDSGLKKSEVDEILLVGGSSRIPKMQELLRECFDGKELCQSINPDEAVACGAAVCANALVNGCDAAQEIVLQDVSPLSLGMAGFGDVLNVFIKRNTRIPTTVKKDSWTTSEDNQEGVTVSVYEGEDPVASKNHLLGRFCLLLGERTDAGVPRLAFTFTMDANGILQVSGENTRTKLKKDVRIVCNKGRLTQQEVDHMAQDHRVSLREKTKEYCTWQKQVLEDPALDRIVSQTQRMSVLHVCNEAIEWLEKQQHLDDVECRRKLFDVQLKCNRLLPRLRPIGLVKGSQP